MKENFVNLLDLFSTTVEEKFGISTKKYDKPQNGYSILRSVESNVKKRGGGGRERREKGHPLCARARRFLITGGAGGSWSPSRENFLVKIQSSQPTPLSPPPSLPPSCVQASINFSRKMHVILSTCFLKNILDPSIP